MFQNGNAEGKQRANGGQAEGKQRASHIRHSLLVNGDISRNPLTTVGISSRDDWFAQLCIKGSISRDRETLTGVERCDVFTASVSSQSPLGPLLRFCYRICISNFLSGLLLQLENV